MNVGIFTELMNAFIEGFSGGFERLRPAVGGLFRILLTLDVLFLFLNVLFDVESLKGIFRKLIALSMWSYVVHGFDRLAISVVDSLIQAGLIAAGQGDLSPRLLLNPSMIMGGAFDATGPLVDQFITTSIWNMPAAWLLLIPVYLLMMVAYFLLALNTFIAMVDYYLALAVTAILMPFGVLASTRFLAMKPIMYFVATGLKLMVIAFIIAVSNRVLGAIRFSSDDIPVREMWIALCATATISMLAWIAPQRLATGLMSGSSAMGGSDLLGHAAAYGRVGGSAGSAAGRVLSSKPASLAARGVGALGLGVPGLAGVALYSAGRSAYQAVSRRMGPTSRPGASPTAGTPPPATTTTSTAATTAPNHGGQAPTFTAASSRATAAAPASTATASRAP